VCLICPNPEADIWAALGKHMKRAHVSAVATLTIVANGPVGRTLGLREGFSPAPFRL
jgi:hypothetical protein